MNAGAVISTPMQKVMDTAVMRSESRGGIVKLPEGDRAKDVTRYTDRIVNHMISHMVKRVREVLNKYVSITITDMTDLIPSCSTISNGRSTSKIAGTGLYLC